MIGEDAESWAMQTRTASQAESPRAAEKRTREMIASGASLKDILNNLCCSIDVVASSVIATVLLMDPDRERLWHTAGTLVSRDWLAPSNQPTANLCFTRVAAAPPRF
jgi:hypothetical protein